MINQSIKQAVITAVTDDSSAYPQGQGEHNEKPVKYTRLSPYGLDTNPPKDLWVLLFSSQAQEAVKLGIASDFLKRFKDLKEGEVALYNTLSKSFVFLKENGDIEIDAKNDLIANVAKDMASTVGGNATIDVAGDMSAIVGGDMSITVTGDVTVNATNITATASAQASVAAPIIDATATTSASVTAPTVNVTATVLATITAATLNVISAVQMTVTSASVLLGAVAGTKKLITEAAISILNGHTHQDSIGGTTSAPSATIGASETTTITKAV